MIFVPLVLMAMFSGSFVYYYFPIYELDIDENGTLDRDFRDLESGIQIFESDSDVSSMRPRTGINNLDDYTVLLIGKYLECPHREFGFLNKYFYNLFMKKHRFSGFLVERHGIFELEDSKSDEGLAFFGQLAFIDDKKHFFNSIRSLLLNLNSFSANHYKLFRFLARTGVLSVKLSDDENKKIRKNPYYSHVVGFFVFDDEMRKYFFDLSKNIWRGFMQSVLDIDEGLYRLIEGRLENVQLMTKFDQKQAAMNVYNYIFQYVSSSFRNDSGTFLLISILSGVPDEWYFPTILNLDIDKRHTVLWQILYKSNFLGSYEDNMQIHGIIDRLLSRSFSNMEDEYFMLMNNIRYGHVDIMTILSEMNALHMQSEALDLNFYSFYRVISMAALTRRYELLQQIKIKFASDIWLLVIENLYYLEHGINVFFALLEIATNEEEKDELFDRLPSIEFILKFYDIDHFEYNLGNSRASFSLILIPEFAEKGFPLTFDFYVRRSLETISFFSRKRSLLDQLGAHFFFQRTERDEGSLVRLLTDFNEFQSLGTYWSSGSMGASSSFLKSVAKSELLLSMIQSMNLGFYVNNTEFARLLESDITILRGIKLEILLFGFIFLIKNFKQVRHLEAFLGASIADIMITRVIPTTSCTQENYFNLSTVLRYWLKSPQRHRMSELKAKFSLFLQLLLKEVDLVDAKFLESILNQ